MAASELQAAVVLIDNSFSSINGDFLPTRLGAEKATVESFSRYFLRGNKESVFGFGTLGEEDFGINTSLTEDLRKIKLNLDLIKPGGKILLEKGIRCGLFALKHRPKEITKRKLIILLSTQHDLTPEKADVLAAIANKDGACIDIFVFGNDAIDKETLKTFVSKLGNKSYFNEIPTGITDLSDRVMKDYMANFNAAMPPESADDFNYNGDDIQRAIEASRAEAGLPPNEFEEMDEDLMRAIQESMKDMDQIQREDEKKEEENKDGEKKEEEKNNEAQTNQDYEQDITNLIQSDQLANILAEFEGVDPNDPRFKQNKDQDKNDDQKK